MVYVTQCAECKGDLAVIEATIRIRRGVPLSPDGFNLWEATSIDTENEVVKCQYCGWEGDIQMEES